MLEWPRVHTSPESDAASSLASVSALSAVSTRLLQPTTPLERPTPATRCAPSTDRDVCFFLHIEQQQHE
eukprot:3502573-Prymnesium_polylepis.2